LAHIHASKLRRLTDGGRGQLRAPKIGRCFDFGSEGYTETRLNADKRLELGMVLSTCGPRNWGGRGRRIGVQGQPGQS
jgi:hypothetical protein